MQTFKSILLSVFTFKNNIRSQIISYICSLDKIEPEVQTFLISFFVKYFSTKSFKILFVKYFARYFRKIRGNRKYLQNNFVRAESSRRPQNIKLERSVAIHYKGWKAELRNM